MNTELTQAQKKPPSKAKIRSYLKELESFLEHGQAIACKTTFDSLKAHFSNRIKPNLFLPRYCIKLVDHDCVFTFLRDRGKSTEGRKPIKDEIAKNTGFQYIKDAGIYYLCNNIPEEAKLGRYINPRLRTQCAIDYSPSLIRSAKRACSLSKPVPDHSWINCWNKNENMEMALIAETCYKSTLIVPMTLRFDQVSIEFWDAFNQSVNTAHPFDKGSFGFLCIDSHEEDFFEQGIDSNFGYVCADMLSLFYIATFLYTSLSPAYGKASSILAVNRGDSK